MQLLFARDIAVLVKRRALPPDPMSAEFRASRSKAIALIEAKLGLRNTIRITRDAGMCATPAFAWTHVGVRPPGTELCTAWANAVPDLRRDVITHEDCHTLGLEAITVRSSADALRNANTRAQVVAFIADRTCRVNSGGNEGAIPPPPSP